MKKLIYAAPLALALALAGCNGSDSATNEKEVAATENAQTDDEKEEKKKVVIETVESEAEKLDSVITNLGEIDNLLLDEKVNLVKTSGPIKLVIKELKIVDVKADPQYADILKTNDIGHVVAIKAKAKNTSKSSVNFGIVDSKMAINGEQADAQYFNNEFGEIMPGASVEGEIFFAFKKKLDKANELTWYVDRPSNPKTWQYIGDKNIQWKIKFQ